MSQLIPTHCESMKCCINDNYDIFINGYDIFGLKIGSRELSGFYDYIASDNARTGNSCQPSANIKVSIWREILITLYERRTTRGHPRTE